jgi:hypothetical protein
MPAELGQSRSSKLNTIRSGHVDAVQINGGRLFSNGGGFVVRIASIHITSKPRVSTANGCSKVFDHRGKHGGAKVLPLVAN